MITALALAAWLVSFGILARFGTWLPFGVVGPLLAFATIRVRAARSVWLRPSLNHVLIGLLSGLLMVGGTHVGYRLAAGFWPGVLPATRALFSMLDTVGLSDSIRAALIVIIATCEEILFRAPLLRVGSGNAGAPWSLASRELSRIGAFAFAYALTTAPLESPLLVVCALVCGCIWGALTSLTGALIAPILAHAVWDLGVLLLWPLTGRR
jgi:uncharacterized protein